MNKFLKWPLRHKREKTYINCLNLECALLSQQHSLLQHNKQIWENNDFMQKYALCRWDLWNVGFQKINWIISCFAGGIKVTITPRSFKTRMRTKLYEKKYKKNQKWDKNFSGNQNIGYNLEEEDEKEHTMIYFLKNIFKFVWRALLFSGAALHPNMTEFACCNRLFLSESQKRDLVEQGSCPSSRMCSITLRLQRVWWDSGSVRVVKD